MTRMAKKRKLHVFLMDPFGSEFFLGTVAVVLFESYRDGLLYWHFLLLLFFLLAGIFISLKLGFGGLTQLI